MLDCIVATCSDIPQLDPDDGLLLEELRAWGLAVEIGVWNDASVDWSAARLCLLRSIWDYPKHYAQFCRWLDAIERVTIVRNPAALVRWNSDKSYLRDLANAGVPTVPTVWLRQGQGADLARFMAELEWREAVVKPARGAASLDVLRVSLTETARAQEHLDRVLRDQDAMVQPYLHAVESYPERSLMFIDGAYSHAVSKAPFDTKLAITGSSSWLVAPTSAERAVAARAIEAVPGGVPLYGRVDLFQSGAADILVNEVELIEPALYFGAHPPAARKIAEAIVRGLAQAWTS